MITDDDNKLIFYLLHLKAELCIVQDDDECFYSNDEDAECNDESVEETNTQCGGKRLRNSGLLPDVATKILKTWLFQLSRMTFFCLPT
jgi:hypothetical protein